MTFAGLDEFVGRSSVRTKILEDLSKGPKTPTELASLEHEHLSHISRALAELKAQGLVSSMPKSSNRRYYKTTVMGLQLYTTVIHTPR